MRPRVRIRSCLPMSSSGGSATRSLWVWVQGLSGPAATAAGATPEQGSSGSRAALRRGLGSGAAPLAGLDQLGDVGGLDVALAGPVEADEADKTKGGAFPGELLPLEPGLLCLGAAAEEPPSRLPNADTGLGARRPDAACLLWARSASRRLPFSGPLPVGEPAGFPLGLLLRPKAGFRGSLLGAQQLLRVLDLLGDARAGEVAAQGRRPDAVVGGELPECLPGGAAANQLPVGKPAGAGGGSASQAGFYLRA
jgi:hypothetical protein